jgi:hypothetical protein
MAAVAIDNGTPRPAPSTPEAAPPTESREVAARAAGEPSLEGRAGMEKKKKKKARDMWISFVGRIVAQIVGAVATIVLGVYFVSRSNAPARDAASTGAGGSATAARSVSRSGDVPTIAVLPLQNFSGDPAQNTSPTG